MPQKGPRHVVADFEDTKAVERRTVACAESTKGRGTAGASRSSLSLMATRLHHAARSVRAGWAQTTLEERRDAPASPDRPCQQSPTYHRSCRRAWRQTPRARRSRRRSTHLVRSRTRCADRTSCEGRPWRSARGQCGRTGSARHNESQNGAAARRRSRHLPSRAIARRFVVTPLSIGFHVPSNPRAGPPSPSDGALRAGPGHSPKRDGHPGRHRTPARTSRR